MVVSEHDTKINALLGLRIFTLLDQCFDTIISDVCKSLLHVLILALKGRLQLNLHLADRHRLC